MKYRDLKKALETLTEEQLDCDLTLYDPNEQEYYPADLKMEVTKDTDVLDKGHPFLDITWK